MFAPRIRESHAALQKHSTFASHRRNRTKAHIIMATANLLTRPAAIDNRINDAVSAAVASATTPTSSSATETARSPRGFALYVGLDEVKAAAAGVSLPVLVEALRRTIAELAPEAQTHATVALAPAGKPGRDVDVVRLALNEPGAVAHTKKANEEAKRVTGVTLDLTRKRVVVDGTPAGLTYKEFELLQYLVLREGKTIEREELVSALWPAGASDAPGSRTIDVHVRRLRAKLGAYEDIVRTVRGIGYRFDRHADVRIETGTHTPSPDIV